MISCKSLLMAAFVYGFPLAAHAGCSENDGRAAAQRGLGAWKTWCSACGGTPVEGPRCQPGANWDGGGTGGGMTGDPFVDLGIMVGQELRKGLFGDPEAEAHRQAEREAAEQAAREEQVRRAAEEQRLNDERYRRLMGLLAGSGGLALKGVEHNEPLRLKASTGTFGIRANPDSQSIGLANLKIGGRSGSLEGRDNSSLAQLNRAAYLSRAAAVSPNREDKKIYADAAFAAATGGLVQFEIPPDIEGEPVTEANIFEDVKRRYEVTRAEMQAAESQLRKVQYARDEARILRNEAELKLKHERSKVPGTPAANDEKLIEAEHMLKEATDLDAQVGIKLSQAEDRLGKARVGLNQAEQQTRTYIDELGRKGSDRFRK